MTTTPPVVRTPAREPFAAQMDAPRLSIRHLMIGAFWTAFYLTMMRWMPRNGMEGLAFDGQPLALRIATVAWALCFGAVLTGAGALAYAGIRQGLPMLRYPGYWELLIATGGFLCSWTSRLLDQLLDNFAIHGTQPGLLGWTLSAVMMASCYAMAARRLGQLRWKWVMGGRAVLLMLHFLFCCCWLLSSSVWMLRPPYWVFSFLRAGSTGLSVILCVFTAGVLILDARQRRRRDWLHWTGALTMVVEPLIGILQMVLLRVL